MKPLIFGLTLAIGLFTSGIFFTISHAFAQQINCDPSYPEVCIPPYPPDLNCGDISDRRFAVLPPDPHGFDWNNDGIGCEIGGGQSGGLPVQETAQGTVQCGQIVQGIVTLTANLTCSEDGLIVGSDGTTINLNGFGIYGPGADSDKIGIGVSENNIIINGPGNISGFQAGILATNSRGLSINSAILQGNQIGVFLTGSSITSIKENTIKNNNIAVASHSATRINAEDNSMVGNALAGVTLVNTIDSTFRNNSIQGSQNGIFLDAQSTGNTVQLNNARGNVVDLNNANGLGLTVNQNTFSDNNCQVSNPSGLCFGR
jgi:parallel beta-helix repeat protein